MLPLSGFSQDQVFYEQDLATGPLLYRYSTQIVLDTLLIPDFYELYFTISDVNIIVKEKKKTIEYNLHDTALYKIKRNLAALKIDTSKFILSTLKTFDAANSYLNKTIYSRTKTYRTIVSSSCDLEAILESAKVYGFISLKSKAIIDQSKQQIEFDLSKKAIENADSLATNFAKNQKLKVKSKEKLSEYYNCVQKTEDNWNNGNTQNNETYINMDNMKYTIYMNITYVFE